MKKFLGQYLGIFILGVRCAS